MKRYVLVRAGGVAGLCAVAGAAAGIAGSAAAPSSSKPAAPKFERHAGFMGIGGPPVHSEAVVPNQAGTGFDKVTMDRGTVKSVSGNTLTISEGTKTATYNANLALTLTNPTVRRNDAAAQLSDLQAGDRVNVAQTPKGTFVIAEDAAHQKQQEAQGFRRFRGGPGGPEGPGGPGGPPPGAPMRPGAGYGPAAPPVPGQAQ